jgi:hypothetical protein
MSKPNGVSFEETISGNERMAVKPHAQTTVARCDQTACPLQVAAVPCKRAAQLQGLADGSFIFGVVGGSYSINANVGISWDKFGICMQAT